MKVVGILFIILGIISGLFGVRSYLRDDAYAKASVVAESTVKWAKVEPNSSGKTNASISLMLLYMRDGVLDSLEETYPQFFSREEPLPTVEELKSRKLHIRYVPKTNRAKNIPDWVMVSNKDEHYGLYGRSGFKWMFSFITAGILFLVYNRVRRKNRKPF